MHRERERERERERASFTCRGEPKSMARQKRGRAEREGEREITDLLEVAAPLVDAEHGVEVDGDGGGERDVHGDDAVPGGRHVDEGPGQQRPAVGVGAHADQHRPPRRPCLLPLLRPGHLHLRAPRDATRSQACRCACSLVASGAAAIRFTANGRVLPAPSLCSSERSVSAPRDHSVRAVWSISGGWQAATAVRRTVPLPLSC
jgi:hypothetical protein